jgi:hypothetical protein
VEPRKHYLIPDTQVAPGDPLDHLEWIGQDIARRKPDVIVHIGDHWHMDSLSMHDSIGSLSREGARVEDDIVAGLLGMERLVAPIRDELARIARRRITKWRPRMVFCEGNHEYRVQRAVEADPRWIGTLSMRHMDVERFGFERHEFLKPVEIDGVHYAHYWQSEKTSKPIGGSMDNRLNKICVSFVCGHEQGLLLHRRDLPVGKTIHAVIAGSCYLKAESYRGAQRSNEWRGVVVLNDVRNGDFEPMPLTLRYLCREATGEDLVSYMQRRYPGKPWDYLG